jgi:Domain of unknown function (DUF4328)/Protein of unknown function (DUF2510)
VSDDVSGYPGAPPGWYADPAGGPGQRWWDGYAWTEATVAPEVPPPPPAAAPPPAAPFTPPTTPTPHWASSHPGYGPPPGYGGPPAYASAAGYGGVAGPAATHLVARELSIFPVARIAVAIPALNYLAGLISLRIHRVQLLQDGHQFRRMYEAAQQGRSAPAFHGSSTLNPLTSLLSLLTIVAVVFACIWQYRAASAARALGVPAKHSPGWGVGSWFVPVVNIWMPYQAIRDCLAPEDPNRPLVLRWWLIFTATWILNAAASAASFFSSGVALGLAIPAAVVAVGLLATAPQVVASIGAAHRAALPPQSGV